MKSAVVILTVLVPIIHARFVQTRIASRDSQKTGDIPEYEESRSALMSPESLQQPEENLSGSVVVPDSLKMDELSTDSKNGDQCYVLVPLRDLMRSRRDSTELSGDDADPLYVMFPYQEIDRQVRDFDGDTSSNGTAPTKRESQQSVGNIGKSERRERRGISSQARWLLKTRKIAKRRPHAFSVRRERMSLNGLNDYDDNLHDEQISKRIRPCSNFSSDQSGKKHKSTIYLTEMKSPLHPEMFEGLHQKPRVLTDFSDLNPKVMQAVIGKPKKSSANPINITMFISNLIPPNEVENTRITNAGKLYKSGCLKFSIQLERPGSCSCTPDDDDQNGKPSCGPMVTQKVAFVHPGAPEDKGKPMESLPSSTTPSSCAHQAAAKGQSGTPDAGDNSKSSDPGAMNRDVSSLLLQLIGTEKKLPKRPTVSAGQTILLDNDVIKELQKILSNQASKGADPAGKSVGATQAPAAPAAPISPNSPKARAIAEALNLFSKYSSFNQNSS